MKQKFGEVLRTLGLVLFFMIALGLIIFFISNPQTFERTKNVVNFVFDIFVLGSAVSFLGTRLKANIEKYGTISKALTGFLKDEPLLHIFLWVFILVQVIVFCYVLPVYYLKIEVKDQGSLSTIAPQLIEDIKIQQNENEFPLLRSSAPPFFYTSPRFLSWGDTIRLHVQAKDFNDYHSVVAWPAFAFFDIFHGVRQTVQLTSEAPVHVTLTVDPATATIHILVPMDTVFIGAGTLEIMEKQIINLSITNDGYASLDTVIIAEQGKRYDFSLKRVIKPGKIKFLAFTEGGTEVERMDIYINDRKLPEKTGQYITLAPGSYRVKLIKERTANERAVVDQFVVNISAGMVRTESVIVRIEKF